MPKMEGQHDISKKFIFKKYTCESILEVNRIGEILDWEKSQGRHVRFTSPWLTS